MSSSLDRKGDPPLRLVSDEEAAVVPEDARPSDDSPTVISKTPPIVEPNSSTQDKIVDLARKSTPESIVASLRGRRLAHFELIEPIGVGGMAAVIRARDTQLDRFVALKILPPEMSHEPDVVQRFHQEAKAAAKLDHENIARVFFCGEDQGLHFIAFEFVEGINLRTMLDQRGRLPVAEAVRYILQIATGLEHAATRGVVHRDVKPSNIIITPTGRAKLVDMGLARNLERRGQNDLTQSGMTLGTFDYISPEQALEPRDADMRSDIYSLGCTFYHLLTGQPSVPEGTPAKKLYHHQHLPPVDPRQIDAGIPDDVVMILAKMMAKHPADRYQRPIHLVHHLMQVARKVGAADDLPEGVMFVDTPLPGQPRNRPVLFIGAALLALIAVTLLLGWSSDPTVNSSKGGGPPKKYSDDAKATLNGNGGSIAPVQPAAASRPEVVTDLPDLRAVVGDAAPYVKARIDAGGVINLDGLVFKGGSDRRLELESEDADNAILRFYYQGNAAQIGLLIEGGEEVVFRKIKFQIDSDTTPNQAAVAALALRGVKRAVFDQCIFVQKVPGIPPPGIKRVPLASLLIDVGEGGERTPTAVELRDCYFDSDAKNGGQVAVAVNGPARIVARDTAFRPHSALFSFRDKCTLDGTSLDMQHCTGFVVTGPAFRFSSEAAATIRAAKSVFARPSGKIAAPGLAQPGLIYLGSDKRPIQYTGQQNVYYALNDYVEKKDGLISKSDDFKALLAKNDWSDTGATYIETADAARNPLALADPLSEAGLLAFQMKYEYAQLGLRTSWLGALPKAPAPLAAKTPAGPKKLIVGRGPGECESIAEALSRAKSDDIIEIKCDDNREVEVPPLLLRPGISITLKAFEGFQPILVLDRAYKEKDCGLFKLQEGRLQLEQLEFLLKPGERDDFGSQAIVHLGEAAQCAFKQCVISLRSEGATRLTAATFLDLERMMKMEAPAPPPSRLEFHECLIRGKGDLVGLRGCRPLQVDMRNSLAVLDGALLNVNAADKALAMDQGVRWRMERTSAFVTDSLFALRSMTGMGLARTEADVRGCFFGSLQPDRPVVLLDMKSSDLEKYLDWKGEGNFYANFDKDAVREWKNLFSEAREFGKIAFPKLTDERRQALWDAEPDWFRPDQADLERVQNFGLPAESAMKLMQLLNNDDAS